MTESIPRYSWSTPFWLTCGFRPFFLLGSLAMAVSVLAWLPLLLGAYQVPTTFTPRDWHVHTMLFGALPAIIAGFALTAVSTWTGRPHVAGRTLLALVLLWIAGRIAVSASALIGAPVAALVDLAFLAALVAIVAREVLAARNHRNLVIVGAIALLGLANGWFHWEAMRLGMADHAPRAAISIILMLLMLVGGRIIPAFTGNWLKARDVQTLPAAVSRLDGVALAISGMALLAWTGFPRATTTGILLGAAGVATALRLSRWRGMQTWSEPLLTVLHLGYATIALGFLAVAASILADGAIDPASAVHVWTMGSFGLMTLAVMTRASRGHSGQPLKAGRLEIILFVLVLAGALARVVAPHAPGMTMPMFELAGLAWAAAYLGFVAAYGRMLLLRPARP